MLPAEEYYWAAVASHVSGFCSLLGFSRGVYIRCGDNPTKQKGMGNLSVAHYLGVYQMRLGMQEKGITNPPEEIKALVRIIVDKLSKLPSDEIIILSSQPLKMIDSRGNVIAEFPD